MDGTWYRGSILARPALVDATLDLHMGKIDEQTYARLVEARRDHPLSRSTTSLCRAYLRCCPHATGTDGGTPICPLHPPAPRRVDPSLHAALRQRLPHMGARWRRAYGALPRTVEALHAETPMLALLLAGRPAPVGHAEASLLAGVVLAAVNLRRIDRALRPATPTRTRC